MSEEKLACAHAAADHLRAARLLLQHGGYRFSAFLVGVVLEALREEMEKKGLIPRPPNTMR